MVDDDAIFRCVIGKQLELAGFHVQSFENGNAVAEQMRRARPMASIVDMVMPDKIGAPRSTRNAAKARDPDMHQTRKGQQWYVGMELHIGVDSQSGWAPSAVVTLANVHDKHPLPDLLHGNERRVYGESAYASQKELIAGTAPKAQDFTNQRARFKGNIDQAVRAKNRNKSRIRARLEHVFGVVKRLRGLGKVRYRGLQKNVTRAFTALARANIYRGRQSRLAQARP